MEKKIQQLLMKFLYPQGNRMMDCNFSGFGLGECDVIAISDSKLISEFEIKISKSDFKADFKKPKHEAIKRVVDGWQGIEPRFLPRSYYNSPNKFSYVCPEGLIKPEEIPSYYGLFYVNEAQVWRVQMPKILHKHKASDELIEKICRQLTSKMTYGCAYLTYKNKQNKFN